MGSDSSTALTESILCNDDMKQMDEQLEIQLIQTKKDIKRKSDQTLKLFKNNTISIHAITYSNTNNSKEYVLDIVGLFDDKGNNTNKSLIIVMCGSFDIEAYVFDTHHLDKTIYFKKKYDMNMKIKMMVTMINTNMIINNIINSITIHPNNKYIAMIYDKVIKIFKICIDYKQLNIISLKHETNIISPNNNDDIVTPNGKHFNKVIFLGNNFNHHLNELILIQNIKNKKIIIYNFVQKKILYTYDVEYIEIQYNNNRKYITVLTHNSLLEMFDISASTNDTFNGKRVFSYAQLNCISDYYCKKIQIISMSPNGKYLLTSPRLVNEQFDSPKHLIKPFDIYKINENELMHCDIKHFGKIQKRMKIVEHFGPNTTSDNNVCYIENDMHREDSIELYDYNHINDAVEYDSDVSSRYGEFQESYNFDHVSFVWISDNIFVFIIDELEEHPHFGELLIVALDMFEMTLKQKQSIIDVTKEKYNIFVHNGIIEFIATFLNGISCFQKMHIRDHGYRHTKKKIICDKVNRCFGVYGWDKSLRFHFCS